MKVWKYAVMRNAGKNVVSAHRGMTRLFYDLMGRFYDSLYHRLIRGYVESARTLMKDLVKEGDTVLDIGCGTGLLSYLAIPEAKLVVGVDLSEGMLRKGLRKRKAGQPVHFVVGDALNPPLKCQFDCIVTAFMLVMLPRDKRRIVIEKMFQMLKPGGRVAFLSSTPEMGNQWESKEEWVELLSKLGFSSIHISQEGDVFMNVIARKPMYPRQGETSVVYSHSISAIGEENNLSEGFPAPVS